MKIIFRFLTRWSAHNMPLGINIGVAAKRFRIRFKLSNKFSRFFNIGLAKISKKGVAMAQGKSPPGCRLASVYDER